jgi:hypothetical protein
MKIEGPGSPPSAKTASKRDPRVDVLRGLALLMIFIDHIPNNILILATMHNFGFSDAAEVFVLLAGFSSVMAYGRVFEREGTRSGLRRVVLRLGRLYIFQVGLLLVTLGVVRIWTGYFGLEPTIVAPILNKPVTGLAHALALHAIPTYLDILPLYIVLFGAFPLIYIGLHERYWLTLGLSAALWLAININGGPNLPNWPGGGTWFFNPLAWQLLFTIGSALALITQKHNGGLPRISWLVWLSIAYLVFAFVQSTPWAAWGLPDLRPFELPMPDKTSLNILRLLDMLALAYLVLSSERMRHLASYRLLRPIEACGRHSLEVFAAGCVFALFGRLLFRTYGPSLLMQITVNTIGIIGMCLLAFYLERQRELARLGAPASVPAPAATEKRG